MFNNIYSFTLDLGILMTLGNVLGLIALIAFSLLLGAIGLIISYLISPSKPNLTKRLRYETGNPPKGRARGLLGMQYYLYILLFLIVEPIFIFLFLIIPSVKSSNFALILGIAFLMYLLPLYYGIKLTRISGE